MVVESGWVLTSHLQNARMQPLTFGMGPKACPPITEYVNQVKELPPRQLRGGPAAGASANAGCWSGLPGQRRAARCGC